MDAYTLKSIDELESIHHGAAKLAGAELGIESFGLQVFDFPEGFEQYPEHNHADEGQEEVYVILRGSATFELDRERVEIQEGQLLAVAPETRRSSCGGAKASASSRSAALAESRTSGPPTSS
jgi:uncharacterized cupin superfamily protein